MIDNFFEGFEPYKPFIEKKKEQGIELEKIIEKECQTQIYVIENLLNNIDQILQSHLFTFELTHQHYKHESHTVILSAVYKNFYILYSALELQKKGLHGSARALLRQSFEFLILGKFCALTENNKIFLN
ncbi:hypothetical protein WCX49_03620 [Sulfurimonas sp. HSL-1656]|uniref:hypothetical protein n=1 Tax=Thiomicrolovo subterrani TaxID=3131934 RepID=UPI0031F7E2A1